MSIATDRIDGGIPSWDTADRMRKALRHANLGVQEMADYLEVSRNTVSTWINGRISPSSQTLRLWAMRCGVDYHWLRDDPTPGGPISEESESACTVTPFERPPRSDRIVTDQFVRIAA